MSRDPKISRWRRSDWEGIKDDIMLKALLCKFTQHKKLKKKLLDTGSKRLVEHTFNDSYWGDGGDGSGSNKLGQLLMEVRKKLQAVCDKPVATPSLPKRTESFLATYGGSASHRLQRSSSFSDLRTLKSEMGTVAGAISDYLPRFTKTTRESSYRAPPVHTSSRATALHAPRPSSMPHTTKPTLLSQKMSSGTGTASSTFIPHGGRKSLSRPRPLPPGPGPNYQSSHSSSYRLNRANIPSDNRDPITGRPWP